MKLTPCEPNDPRAVTCWLITRDEKPQGVQVRGVFYGTEEDAGLVAKLGWSAETEWLKKYGDYDNHEPGDWDVVETQIMTVENMVELVTKVMGLPK